MKKTIILITALFIIAGCNTPKRINRLKARYCHDYTITTVKDSLIKIPIYYTDSAFMQLFLACDSNGQIYQTNAEYWQGKYSSLESRLVDNKVYVHNTVKIRDTVTKIVTNTVKVTGANIYKEKPFSQWVSFRLIGFWVLLAVIVIYLVLRYLKGKFSWANKFIP